MRSSYKSILNQSKDYVAIIFGLLCVAFGYSAFILPSQIVTGGVTGIATIIYFACDKSINIAVPNYGINVLLLLISFRTVGKQFVIRTIFGATVLNVIFYVLSPCFTAPLVEGEPFMSIVLGSILCGIGLGLTFSHNGSSGGTDIVAAMVTKHSNVSFGRMMLYCDLLIISSSYFLFHKIDNLVYGYVFLVLNSIFSDATINNRFQSVQFLIFSDKWAEIANAIEVELHRGCTLLHGMGWYSKQDENVLLVICRKYERIMMQRIIKSIDPNAFISVVNTSSVFGEGFDQMKVRLRGKATASQAIASNNDTAKPATKP